MIRGYPHLHQLPRIDSVHSRKQIRYFLSSLPLFSLPHLGPLFLHCGITERGAQVSLSRGFNVITWYTPSHHLNYMFIKHGPN